MLNQDMIADGEWWQCVGSAVEVFRPQFLGASRPFLEDVGVFLPLGSKGTAMGWQAVSNGTTKHHLGR